MTSFTVNVNVEKENDYFNINFYLDNLVESEDHVEDMVATLLVKSVMDKMDYIRENISEEKISNLISEYDALIKEAIASEESKKTE